MIPKWIENNGKLYLYKGYRTGRSNISKRIRDLKWGIPGYNAIKICSEETEHWNSKYYIYIRPSGD